MDKYDVLRKISTAKIKKNRVVFFGRDNFSDNSKYLYLHAIFSHSDFEPVWCTQNTSLALLLKENGLPVFDMATQGVGKTLSFLIEARSAVFCTNMLESLGRLDYMAALEGANKIQLWHGVSIKKLDLMLTPYGDLTDQNFTMQLLGVVGADYLLSPSCEEDKFFIEAFGKSALIRAGLPRNEVLVRPANKLDLINSAGQDEFFFGKSKPYVLLAPTYSRHGKVPLWEDEGIIGEFLKFTMERGGHLVIKPHPFEASKVPPGGIFDEVFTLLPADFDIYPLLSCMDMVVTDYSSLFIDFILLDRPVVIIDMDADSVKESRLYEPERYLFATYHANVENLASVLAMAIDEDTLAESRLVARNRAFGSDPLTASADIAKYL